MPPTLTRSTILKWALTSRILTAAWCVLSDALLPDHAATDVRTWQADQEPRAAGVAHARRSRRWDAAHLLRVARFGYVTDRRGVLSVVSLCSALRYQTAPVPGRGRGCVVAGTLLSNACFVGAVILAYDATLHFRPALADRTALALCATPASVFCSVPYSSPGRVPGLWRRRLIRTEPAVARFCTIRGGRFHPFQRVPPRACGSRGRAFEISAEARPVLQLLGTSMRSALVLLPPVAKDLWHFHETGEARSFRARAIFGWGVGLFSYWRFKQSPNFMLAAPALASP